MKISLALILLFSLSLGRLYAQNSLTNPINVSVANGPKGLHILKGDFSIQASSETVWKVLSDYDHLANFVSSVRASRTIKTDNNKRLIEQTMTGKAGFFRKSVYLLLEVEEIPFEKIYFKDTSLKSFKRYAGLWTVTSENSQTHVSYHLEATPNFFSPDFISAGAFKRNVEDLLQQLRDQIASKQL